MSVWKRVNQGHDFIRMNNVEKVTKGCSVEKFLNEEFQNALTLVQTIHKYFTNLNKICKGIIKPDEKHLAVGYLLLNYKVSCQLYSGT